MQDFNALKCKNCDGIVQDNDDKWIFCSCGKIGVHHLHKNYDGNHSFLFSVPQLSCKQHDVFDCYERECTRMDIDYTDYSSFEYVKI